MIFSLSLRSKIICTVLAMSLVTLGGCCLLFWYSYKIDHEFKAIVQEEMVLYKLARDMELALANQKGFLTYYLVDGDGRWLDALGQYRQIFLHELENANNLAKTPQLQTTLEKISQQYTQYIEAKQTAIVEYRAKNPTSVPEGINISDLHEKQRDVFFRLLERCQSFSSSQWNTIEYIQQKNSKRASDLRKIAFATLIVWFTLSSVLIFILYKNILEPIRGLAIKTGGSQQDNTKDEVVSLSQSLNGMMKNFDETHDELEKSRKHLLQAERMAMVGELAAGVAHTIRNPFTSIKMRMFSLKRSLEITHEQNEDIAVISDEIGRVDKIVQNFLEFARSPKLQLELCNLSDIIYSVMVLLEYRLKKHDVKLIYEQNEDIPEIMVDADRIKEMFVNLITNSCEAMNKGGTVKIHEKRTIDDELGEVVTISIIDDGTGIDEKIIHKITAPFFTTKNDGSGLGLSIVKRIVQEHKGKLAISSSLNGRTEITVILSVKGGLYDSDSHH